ncbi:MAG TPA: hypothetical protein VEJ87_03835 [Acidimicrobiales bacterium]|nr:hypothetical protein [Acidimicrobiales bacterium]
MTQHSERYGYHHKQLRRKWKLRVERGDVDCARCGKPVFPFQAWDLDHKPGGGPYEYLGVSHAKCNRATLTHAREEANRRWSRDW